MTGIRSRNGVSLRDNPVLRRELIERMRGARAVVFLTVWLGLLTGVCVLAYLGTVSVNNQFGIDIGQLGRIGREIYEWVLFGMLVLLLFFVPGLTAGAITGERERQTLVPLQVTLMRPVDIVIGKLSAALAFLVFLVVAALPLLGVSLLVGGVGFFDLFRGLGMLLFTGLVLGSVCVWISSVVRKTTAATVISYALSLVFTIGSFIVMIVLAIVQLAASDGFDDPWVPRSVLGFNPFGGVASALPSAAGNFSSDTSTPFGGMRQLIDEIGGNRNFNEEGFAIVDGSYVWVVYLLVGTALFVLSTWRATKNVSTPADTER